MTAVRTCLSILLVLVLTVPAAAQKPDLAPLEATIQRITARAGGRVGIGLIHLESGATLHIRGNEQFPMASVVKLPIAIAVLQQVADRTLSLDRAIWLNPHDIRPCCTLERRHPRGGTSRTIRELLELALIESDNTAADVLLRVAGGPDAVEARMRRLGFARINVDRYEGQLLLDIAGVVNAPPLETWTIDLQRRLVAAVERPALELGRARFLTDVRDTATPCETAQLLGRLMLGDLLPRAETELLLNLMTQAKTGRRRLKGHLPAGTLVAHKTGSTAIVINDVGLITLPADSRIGGHLAIAAYVANGAGVGAMERAIAQTSAAAFGFFRGAAERASVSRRAGKHRRASASRRPGVQRQAGGRRGIRRAAR